MSNEGHMKSANDTYEGFVGLMKFGTLVSIILAAIVVLLISS